jgi:hypothetical protein
VIDGDALPKEIAEPRDELRRERDLWDEHDRLSAPLKHMLTCAQIDFSFAAVVDAVEEEDLPLGPHPFFVHDSFEGALLPGRERDVLWRFVEFWASAWPLGDRDQARARKRMEGAAAAVDPRQKLSLSNCFSAQQGTQYGRLLRSTLGPLLDLS